MTDKQHKQEFLSEPNKDKDKGKVVEESSAVDVSKLTKEEQMALYEKDLKENDWGHQPCWSKPEIF